MLLCSDNNARYLRKGSLNDQKAVMERDNGQLVICLVQSVWYKVEKETVVKEREPGAPTTTLVIWSALIQGPFHQTFQLLRIENWAARPLVSFQFQPIGAPQLESSHYLSLNG